ncbi:hypothetical protein [Grimontia sp. SpTr1]|uniref:hypothetical protein n=1 Tax=Grimontia sp. SpTr1 TaxID=2995319 RepID=UPI00248AB9C9|nr:hypothetical protein [Grimontia sp. SpTr1]
MLKLAGFVLVSNLIVVAGIWGFDQVTGLFGITRWIDYVFGAVTSLWGLSILFLWLDDSDSLVDADKASVAASSLVDNTIAAELNAVRRFYDSRMFLKLFFAGLPAFGLCVSYAVLS